jgi:hypothetical protein
MLVVGGPVADALDPIVSHILQGGFRRAISR